MVSGTGTVLRALLAEKVPISIVIADRECPARAIAAEAGVTFEIVDRAQYRMDNGSFDRWAFTNAIIDAIDPHRPLLIVMAGFMTILDEAMFDRWPQQVLNTHPSLLPFFSGGHAVEETLAAGATESGCTIHIATATVDAGPILAQEVVPVFADDTADILHERIKEVERVLYPRTVLAYASALIKQALATPISDIEAAIAESKEFTK